MQSWEKFGHNLGSNYWQAKKKFWETIVSFFGKTFNIARSNKDKNGVLLYQDCQIKISIKSQTTLKRGQKKAELTV